MNRKQLARNVHSAPRFVKKMRVIIELDCDNHAAMFNRENFDNKVINHVKQTELFLGHPVRYIATEEIE